MNIHRKHTLAMPLLAAVIAGLGLAGCGGSDNAPSASSQANSVQANSIKIEKNGMAACAELNGMTIAAKSIGLPTTGAAVTSTQVVPAAGTGATAVGEYCKVLGEINPVDPNAPKIKFQLNLPADWNEKAMMFGGGGYNGIIATGVGNVPAGPANMPVPLGRGYATFGSDSGHQANAAGSRDGSFGMNDEALRNFAGDAIKKTHDAAMEIIKAGYGKKPKTTYFAGGSTGGREALLAVGNWPKDFDGAIVLYPAWNAAALDLQLGRITRQLAMPGAYPNREKRKVLFDATLEACDALDNVQDGLISNMNACNAIFDPSTATLNGNPIRCAGGNDTGNDCLSDAQIASFNVFNTPLKLNYALANGDTSYPGFNVWGTDFGNPGTSPLQPTVLTLSLGTEQPAYPMPPVGATTPPYGSTFWDEWVKYFVTRDPTFNSLTLDPQNPGPWQPRIVELTGIQDANRTDLFPFKHRGGKILMAHGKHDALVSTRATQQYYTRLRNAMGAESVDLFMRYYEIPGYGHAISSVFNAAWDSLTTLENWVEKGIAPPPQVVADTAGVPGRTRPLCQYPSWPKYDGSGDINLAANYTCATQ